jgi:hypothetical protein
MAQLAGSIDSVPLPSLLAFLHSLKKTGYIQLTGAAENAEIGLDQGVVVGAAFGSDHGVEALETAVLALREGEFAFTEGIVSKAGDINADTGELVAHLEEIAQERDTLELDIPWYRAVPTVNPAIGELGEVTLDGETLETLLAIDGRRTLREIGATGAPGRTGRAIRRLRDASIITIDGTTTNEWPAA